MFSSCAPDYFLVRLPGGFRKDCSLVCDLSFSTLFLVELSSTFIIVSWRWFMKANCSSFSTWDLGGSQWLEFPLLDSPLQKQGPHLAWDFHSHLQPPLLLFQGWAPGQCSLYYRYYLFWRCLFQRYFGINLTGFVVYLGWWLRYFHIIIILTLVLSLLGLRNIFKVLRGGGWYWVLLEL